MQLTKILLDYHRRMLGDETRTEALRRALAAAVRPGDVVVDVGTGTGVLACFACAAGARRVYAIESGPILEVARAVVAENGWTDRVVFLRREARRVRLPERVDLVVSETLGSLGVEENITEILADARRRFLKPGGKLLPSRVRVYAAPVSAAAYDRLVWPEAEKYGVRFGLLRELFANTVHRTRIGEAELLGPPVPLYDLDFHTAERLPEAVQIELTIKREGTCHGVACWFAAYAGDALLVETAPTSPPTHWEQAFFPVANPCPVTAGAHLDWELRALPTLNEVLFTWSGTFHLPYAGGSPGPSFHHSSLRLVPPWQGVDLAAKERLWSAARRGGGILRFFPR